MDVNKFSEYDQKYLSEDARKAIAGYRQQALKGEKSWDEANKLAENWRIEAGYYGGADGMGYTAVADVREKIHPSNRMPASMLRQEDEKSFDYFKGTDQYKTMLDSYQRGGKLAMQDTVADVAARTGGLASSYAGAAGQQMYNQYMKDFDEVARTEYQNYLDRLVQEEQLKKADEETAYNRQQTALDRELTAQQTEYNKLLTQAQILEGYGDFSGYKALGYTDEQIANMQKVWEDGNTVELQGGEPVYGDDVIAVAAVLDCTPEQARAYKNIGGAAWWGALDDAGYGSSFTTPAAAELWGDLVAGETSAAAAKQTVIGWLDPTNQNIQVLSHEIFTLCDLLGIDMSGWQGYLTE